MIERVKGQARAEETPVGLVPTPRRAQPRGPEPLERGPRHAAAVDREEWAAEVPEIRAFFDRFGDRCPQALHEALDSLSQQLTAARV